MRGIKIGSKVKVVQPDSILHGSVGTVLRYISDGFFSVEVFEGIALKHFQYNVYGGFLEVITDEVTGEAVTKADSQQPSAFSIIQEAADCLKNRASERDKPDGERSMKATIGMFEHATGVKLSEEQGWLFMVCLKIARSQGGGFKLDDFIDMTAYAALSGEAANNERNNND